MWLKAGRLKFGFSQVLLKFQNTLVRHYLTRTIFSYASKASIVNCYVQKIKLIQFVAGGYVVTVAGSTAFMAWVLPHAGPFPSRFFCQDDDDVRCPPGIRSLSLILHTAGQLYAWSSLLIVNILEIAHAMYLKERFKVTDTIIEQNL